LLSYLVKVNFYALIIASSERAFTGSVVTSLFVTELDMDYALLNKIAVIAVMPPLFFALIFQKYLTQGLLSGTKKG